MTMQLADRMLVSKDGGGSNVVGVIGITSLGQGNNVVIDQNGLGVVFGAGSSITLPSIGGNPVFSGNVTASRFYAGDGTSALPSVAGVNFTGTGLYWGTNTLNISVNGTQLFQVNSAGNLFLLAANPSLAFGAGADVILVRDGAANILALKNGVNPQEFRVYGTTTGPAYLSISHNSVNAILGNVGGGALILNYSGAGFLPAADNALDAGSTGNQFRTGFFGTSVVVAAAGAYFVGAAPGVSGTIDATKTATVVKGIITVIV